MKYVYVLEDDVKFRNEIAEAIHKIDPQLKIHYFESLEGFAKWLELFLLEGPSSLPKGGFAQPGTEAPSEDPHQLILLICKNELLGVKHLALLHKTRALFLKKEACTSVEPTSIVLTSFGGPDFDIRSAADSIINNVIFKPFDKLILQQHLAFAITGRRPPSQYFIHNMKTSATIEMLTDVEIEAISDVGLISLSDRPLKPGTQLKFYSPVFNSLKHRSLLARCVHCIPHPQRTGSFRCAFTYLSADPFQITNIRKEVRKKELQNYPYEWAMESRGERVDVALIAQEESLRGGFKDHLEKNFTNVKVHLFPHLQGFLKALMPQPQNPLGHLKNLSAVFVDQSLFQENMEGNWQNLIEAVKKHSNPTTPNLLTLLKEIEFFAFTSKRLPDKDERLLGDLVKDIFYHPIDPIYLLKKLKIFLPQLRLYESIKIPTMTYPHRAKIGICVEVSEFSEAGLVFKHPHPTPIGTLREFVLWLPHEFDFPEFLAACNYHEENSQEKGVLMNYFVFFGINDHYLRHLRRWILQNHVLNKEADAS